MTRLLRPFLALSAVALALVAAGCGGGSSNVPTGSIAVVNGSQISRSELDGWLAQAKQSYKATKQQFPKAGTSEYQQVQTYWVNWLVQYAEFEQAARDLGIKVTSKDIDKGVRDFIKQRFGGDRKKFEQARRAQAYSVEMFRKTVRFLVLNTKIFNAVTKDVEVSTKEAQANYQQNLSTKYQQKASRLIQYILIKKTKSNGAIDFARSKRVAYDVYRQIKSGASFAALAKKYSADRRSAQQGGKVTFQQGQTVAEFDKVAFQLDTGQLAAPVKSSTYGYFIVKALTKTTPAKTTPFSKAEPAIKTTLLQQDRQKKMYDWVQNLNKRYKSKISYAPGFAPPDLPETTDTATQ
jgi:parvulin-like peptidyl-prolyl isomerase